MTFEETLEPLAGVAGVAGVLGITLFIWYSVRAVISRRKLGGLVADCGYSAWHIGAAIGGTFFVIVNLGPILFGDGFGLGNNATGRILIHAALVSVGVLLLTTCVVKNQIRTEGVVAYGQGSPWKAYKSFRWTSDSQLRLRTRSYWRYGRSPNLRVGSKLKRRVTALLKKSIKEQ